MLNIILSVDKNYDIPWNIPEDSILILGRKTFESLGELDRLENRIVF